MHISLNRTFFEQVTMRRLAGKKDFGVQVLAKCDGDRPVLHLHFSVDAYDMGKMVELQDCLRVTALPRVTFDASYLLIHKAYATHESILANIIVRAAHITIDRVDARETVRIRFVLGNFETVGYMPFAEAENYFTFLDE